MGSDQLTSLGDIVGLVRSSLAPSDLVAETIFVGLEDVASKEGRLVSTSRVHDVRSRVNQFEQGDVLYSKLRPALRKVFLAEFSGACSMEFYVLRPLPSVKAEFLKEILRSKAFADYATSVSRGDRPRLPFEALAKYSIRLPSMEEQASVASAVSEQTVREASLDEAFRRTVVDLESLFIACVDRLVWEGRKTTKLAGVTESLSYGTSQKSFEAGRGVPTLRIPNIGVAGTIVDDEIKFTDLSEADRERFALEAGDALVVRSNGSMRMLGKSAIVGQEHEGFAYAGYLIRVRLKEFYNGDFFGHVSTSRNFRTQVEKSARGGSGIFNLSAGRLADFEIPLVALEEQRHIAEVLGGLRSSLRSIALRVEAELAALKLAGDHNVDVELDLAPTELRLGEQARSAAEIHRSQHASRAPRSLASERSADSLDAFTDLVVSFLAKRRLKQATWSEIAQHLALDQDAAREKMLVLLTQNVLEQHFDEQVGNMVLRHSS